MTIAGLPAQVEAALTTLLADHYVKSWTVAGEGQDTVFVLRLNSSPRSSHYDRLLEDEIGSASPQGPNTSRRQSQRLRQRQVGVCSYTFDSEINASVKIMVCWT